MEKTMKARVQHKHDIEANWLKATNFTPLASEIIVYDPDENYDYPRIKIGDGKTNINTLPFITKDYAKISDIPTKPEDIGALPDSTVIPTVPTKISAFENDKGYLTQHQSLDAYAKTADLGALATKDSLTASDVGALPDTTKIPSKLGDLDNDKQYITVAEVPDEIYVGDGTMPNTATIQFIMDASDEEALLKNELQEYINTEIEAAKTKLELDIPEKTSQLTNDSGFITAKDIPEVQVPDLSDYAKTKDIPTKTSQLTNDSGFITQHQSLSGYAKTSDIPTKVSQLTNDSGFITAKDIPEAQVPDLSGYALKSNAETWTFTLSDGSTVTKKVVLA